MAKQLGKLSPKEQKIFDAKFSVTPEYIDKELARQDAVTTKARSKPKTGKARGIANAFDPLAPNDSEAFARKLYSDFPLGKFENEPRLAWIRPDLFRFEPSEKEPFRFIRSTGEVIEPGVMLTTGGSIPRKLWAFKDLSPWAFGPAYLIHDWLFDQHHAGTSDKSFEEVRDIMMEGVRTLMESGVCPKSPWTFDLIYAGIDSLVARIIWNKKKPK